MSTTIQNNDVLASYLLVISSTFHENLGKIIGKGLCALFEKLSPDMLVTMTETFARVHNEKKKRSFSKSFGNS